MGTGTGFFYQVNQTLRRKGTWPGELGLGHLVEALPERQRAVCVCVRERQMDRPMRRLGSRGDWLTTLKARGRAEAVAWK